MIQCTRKNIHIFAMYKHIVIIAAFLFLPLVSHADALTIPDGAIGVTKKEMRKIRKSKCYASDIYPETNENIVCSKLRRQLDGKTLFRIDTGAMYRVNNTFDLSTFNTGVQNYLPDGFYTYRESAFDFQTRKIKKQRLYAVIQDGQLMPFRKKGMYTLLKRTGKLGEFISHVDPLTLALYKSSCTASNTECPLSENRIIYSPDENNLYMYYGGELSQLHKESDGMLFRDVVHERAQNVKTHIVRRIPIYALFPF